jgi:hypothetical protein
MNRVLLNVATAGDLQRNLDARGLKTLTHPYVVLKVQTPKGPLNVRVERNAGYDVRYDNFYHNEDKIIHDVPVNIKVGEFFNNYDTKYGYDKNISYQPTTNNSQFFIDRLLDANGLLTPEIHALIFQNTADIMKNYPSVNAFVNKMVAAGLVVSKFME